MCHLVAVGKRTKVQAEADQNPQINRSWEGKRTDMQGQEQLQVQKIESGLGRRTL